MFLFLLRYQMQTADGSDGALPVAPFPCLRMGLSLSCLGMQKLSLFYHHFSLEKTNIRIHIPFNPLS